MNRLLIPIFACAMLLMAGCENADKPGAPTAPSGQSTVPPPADPSGETKPSTSAPPAPGSESTQRSD
jgi:hypothetical protein